MVDALALVNPGRDEWRRAMPGWHLAFAALATLTAGIFLFQGGPEAGQSVRYRVAATVCGAVSTTRGTLAVVIVV